VTESGEKIEIVTHDYSALNRGITEVANRATIATRLLAAKVFIERAKAFLIWALVLGLFLILISIAAFIGRGQLDVTWGETTERIRYIKVPDPERSKIIEKTIIVERPIIRQIEKPKNPTVKVSFTIFRTVSKPDNLNLDVVTGLKYENYSSQFPNYQYCYADRSFDNKTRRSFNLASKDGSKSIEITKVTKSQADSLKTSQELSNTLHTHCQFEAYEQEPSISNREDNDVSKYPPKVGTSVGTGFAVNSGGFFVTNAHVVENCTRQGLILDGKPIQLRLIAKDDQLDIAVLRNRKISIQQYLMFSDTLKTGQDVLAFGYPLQGELSREIKVTDGIVSSLAGIKNDRTRIQITAALQPGNSGGPVVDNNGLVVGVSVSGLRGEEYQNINFAVKKDSVLTYLSKTGVEFGVSSDKKPKANTDIVERMKKAVLPIFCILGN
jgi:hypothetical protein